MNKTNKKLTRWIHKIGRTSGDLCYQFYNSFMVGFWGAENWMNIVERERVSKLAKYELDSLILLESRTAAAKIQNLKSSTIINKDKTLN